MKAPRVYLDHNATTPLHPAARAAMSDAFEVYGNPSSIHEEGRAARAIIDDARRSVAALIGCAIDDVFFTSGATEALNIVLTPKLALDGGKVCEHLLVGAGEHPAVLSGHRFRDRVTVIPMRPDGTINLDALRETLMWFGGKRIMLALQAANNETGVIQPVREAAELVHESGGFVVCDAVQAPGKMTCDISGFGADAVAISAHKFGGPKGVGALCFSPSKHHLTAGVVRGGGQERGLRAGTENLAGVAGFGAAARVATDSAARHVDMFDRRNEIERRIADAVPGALVFGSDARRLPNTVCVSIPGCEAQTLVMSLDLEGVAVSAGSACSSGKVKPSHVLSGMGVRDDLVTSSIRISVGWMTTRAEIETFAFAFAKVMKTMRPRRAA